ncbi:TPOR protein, partial [Psilopogon haemacephalus]|nr:TPOR protein [Psilopogon haemacephalus]
DAALLAGVPEDILCFSRSFEDLTCFWDEEEEAVSKMCHFYYWYSRDTPKVCTVSTWQEGGRARHVCVFPSQDVRLFTELHLRVLDATTNKTKYQRELSVDVVRCCPASFPETPCSTAMDLGGQHLGDPYSQTAISVHPPTARAAAASPGAGQGLVQADTWVVLRDLHPGLRYHIQVRSKPDGTSMDGVWGPWSQAVAAETPHSS